MKLFENHNIVTLDGPSGVGKSTISKEVAARLGYAYLDTGAMYRAVGVCVQRKGVDPESEEAVADEISNITLEFLPAASAGEDVGVLFNGENISDKLRTPEISMAASRISTLSSVRKKLTEMQRNIGARGKIVAEGRDMGTVVFPDAAFKFYLDADPKERARRRVTQLRAKGAEANEEETLNMILQRDKGDRERILAPLTQAKDALLIDTTRLSIEQVTQRILETVLKRL